MVSIDSRHKSSSFSLTTIHFQKAFLLTLCVVIVVSASICDAFEPLFDARIDYTVGNAPQSVCIADFNEDGEKDMAVANYGTNNISILLNFGNGTFDTAINFPTGTGPRSIVAADFDRDGKLDIATANWGSNSVSVLRNLGSASFAGGLSFGTGVNPQSICAADFDGDGWQDIVSANYSSNNVSMLRNNGTNGFHPSVQYTVGGNPQFVSSADIDGNNAPDVIVANGSSNNVSILKNNGTGTFASAVNYGVGLNPWSVSAADLDGDAKIDLAVANITSNSLSILKNTGNGDFANKVDYAVNNAPRSVFASDFDGDGRPDLAATNNNTSSFCILSNNGNGTFSNEVVYGVGANPWCIVGADLDGDGNEDLAVTNSYNGIISTLMNNGNGTFASAVNYSTGSYPQSVFVSDLDDDGKPDLAVANSYSNNISILKNNGNGTFASAVSYGAGSAPHSVFASDFDGDGKPDLAVANFNFNNVSILKNNGNGTFASAVSYGVGSFPSSVFASDLDGDGKPDLAVANSYSDNISILKNNGNGTFASAVSYGVGVEPLFVFAADLDGDGKADLAVANYSSSNVSILKNNGNGTFASAVNYVVGDGPHSVFAADLDGDGKADLAVANYSSSNVSILKNNGDGTFVSSVSYVQDFNPSSVFASDLDGDGKSDLAVANFWSNSASILKNNGNGTFASAVSYGVGINPISVFAADLDGDGKPDLAVANANSDNVSILKNIGNAIDHFCDGLVNSGTTLHCDDFRAAASPEWTQTEGACTWNSAGKTWRASLLGSQLSCVQSVGNNSWKNYRFEYQVKGIAGNDKIVRFRQNGNDRYFVNLRSDWNGQDEVILGKYIGGVESILQTVTFPSQNGIWYPVRIECVDEHITVAINGFEIISFDDFTNPIYSGGIGLVCFTGGEGVCDIEFDNVLVTDPFPHITIDEPAQSFMVGDAVTLSGRVHLVDGSPYIPVSGTIGIEDPIIKFSTAVQVQADGSFSYTTSPSSQSGVWMFIFGVNGGSGVARQAYSVPVSRSAPIGDVISSRTIEIPIGHVERPLSVPADVFSARNLVEPFRVAGSNVIGGAKMMWGQMKADAATSWSRVTGSGLNHQVLQSTEMFARRCSPFDPVGRDNCALLTASYGWLVLETVKGAIWSKAQEGVNLTHQLFPTVMDDCQHAKWTAALVTSEILAGIAGMGSGKVIDIASAVASGSNLGEVVEVIENSADKCLLRSSAAMNPYPFYAAIYDPPFGDMVLLGLVPKIPKAVVVNGYSPINIRVTDQKGRFIDNESSNIPGAEYYKYDSDMDGDSEQVVIVPLDTIGDVSIEITPAAGASSTDTFSVVANYTFYQTPDTIAKDLQISQIPASPFTIATFENLGPPAPNPSVTDSVTFTGFPSTLTWSAVNDPNPGHLVSYDVIVATQADFSDSVVLQAGLSTTFQYHSWMRAVNSVYDTSQFFWKVRAHDDWGAGATSEARTFFVSYCCQNLTGNIDCDPLESVDIADLTVLVDHLFIGFAALCCPEEGNMDSSSGVDIGDLTALVDHLFITFTPLPSCQ